MSSFTYPDIYNFPPFFTIQPIVNTQQKQTQLWRLLILDYCRYHKIHDLDIHEAASTPLFLNNKINRSVNLDGIRFLIDSLVPLGNAVWLDKEKNRCKIIWRTSEQWGDIIYKFILERSMTDIVCSIYELREKEDMMNQEFYLLDYDIFMDALKTLENRGVAKIFTGSTKDSLSVKFFSTS